MVHKIVKDKMREDELHDMITASELHALLVQKGYKISIKSVLQQKLGWTFYGNSCCHSMRDVIKVILL